MKRLTFISTLGDELILTNSAPFLLQSFTESEAINIYSFKGPSQDGSIYIGNNLDAKDMTLEFVTIANSESELIDYRNKILKTLNPKLGEVQLVYKDDIKRRCINCIVNKLPTFNSISGSHGEHGKASSCLVSLTANDPYWKDVELNKKQIALWKGDFHFPLVIPQNKGIIMGHREPSLIVNINNTGNVTSGMVIEFRARGTLKNPSLFNVNTREFIKINKPMLAGEVITINTNVGKKKILQELNGVTTDILNYLDIIGGGDTFLQLDVGDNLFRYNADENLDNLEVSIYYNNNYLGV